MKWWKLVSILIFVMLGIFSIEIVNWISVSMLYMQLAPSYGVYRGFLIYVPVVVAGALFLANVGLRETNKFVRIATLSVCLLSPTIAFLRMLSY